MRIWHRTKKASDDRRSVSREHLQSAITDTVRQAEPGCENFAGVVIKREIPKSPVGANWAIRGVRFGRADRNKSNQALATIVEQAQRYFSLAEEDRLLGSQPKDFRSSATPRAFTRLITKHR